MLRGHPNPVGLGYGMVGVGKQREAKPVLVVKSGQALGRVRANAEDGRSADLGGHVPQPAGLRRATGCVGLRVEINEHVPAPEVR